MFPLSSRHYENLNAKDVQQNTDIYPDTNVSSISNEFLGTLGNVAWDLSLLVGVSLFNEKTDLIHSFPEFLLAKSAFNLPALWIADLWKDFQRK